MSAAGAARAARDALLAAALLVGTCPSGALRAHASLTSSDDPAPAAAPLALDEARVRELKSRIAADLPRIVGNWTRIAEVPAPSGREEARAALLERQFRELGLDEVRRDEIGNVMGLLRGRAPSTRRVVYAAHLDTVASAIEAPRITRPDPETLQGPGIRDDAAGLVGLLEAARALRAMDLRPPNDVWLLATVQEETGLLGARKFLDDNAPLVSRFVAVDGELGEIAYGATGILWLKIHFEAPGGHTLQSRNAPSATRALARTIDALYGLDPPAAPEERRSWLNVSMVGGGDVVNALARDAWLTVDLRSNSPKVLAKLERQARAASKRAARRERVDTHVEEMLRIPGASMPALATSDLVRLAGDALRAAEWPSIRPVARGTADHNRALERGIPGICIGVTRGSSIHTPQERASIDALPAGIAALATLMASLPASR